MTEPAYIYPPGTMLEAIEAFRTMFGQTPEEDIRLGSTFEIFLKGFVSGRISVFEKLSCSISDLRDSLEDLESSTFEFVLSIPRW